MLQRELDGLPEELEKLDNEIKALTERISEPEFYKEEPKVITECQAELKALEDKLAERFNRWEELEAEQQQYSE